MRIRLFGKVIYISKPVKIILISVFIIAMTVLGFMIDRQYKKGAVFSEILSEAASTGENPAAETEPLQTDDPVSPVENTPGSSAETPAPGTLENMVLVYIVGEVRSPDVYALPAGSILLDLVQTAGGFTEKADKEAVNLAYPLQNNMMIRIPALTDQDKSWLTDEGQKIPAGGGSAQVSAAPQKVNINTAGIEELCTLPGIGEATAQKIVEYRTKNGPFKSIEEITNVSGIKNSRYEQIKEKITV